MPNTSDNDKKARDNQAKRHEKNMMREKNREAGKFAYSKKTGSSPKDVLAPVMKVC
ncbi:DUF3941 domain-containing protein [Geobacillus stearothermophilus]|uniref:DUF3941 domain-containing protein n=1 Tax=Geobacillus stearothermophilus TaxID=1422 RepID=UPI002E1D0B48|nr:DUF3941 domain-containing protein [Geobacillus stearothermophilus]MED4987518.1 DUF3941 domain-containing protein [Geobacillus stearothermophilus]